MASLQCISCNSTILETTESCKCGHVNEAMRTIAGKRFSGYREELYTRRVIKESRDEYRRMKRKSRGMNTRLRRGTTESQSTLSLTERERRQLVDISQLITADHKTRESRDVKTMTSSKALLTKGDHMTEHLINNQTYINTATNRDESRDYEHVTTHDVTMNKRRGQYRKNHHLSRPTTHDHRTTTTKSLLQEQLSMAGPLAEINKRLMNQRVFWMCLAP